MTGVVWGLTAIVLPIAASPLPNVQPEPGRACLSASETREAVAARKLTNPVDTMRRASELVRGEALRAKLCAWNQELVYEITVLRPDGRLIRVYLNANDGHAFGARNNR